MITHNPKVFHIKEDNQIERCQFIYENNKQCERDARYRIGKDIFLCGYHTPGIGRYKKVSAIEEQ